MIQTLFIYISLLVIMVFLASLSAKIKEDDGTYLFKNALNGPILFLMVLFSVVFGMRYNVGVDHLAYLKDYETLKLFNIPARDTEPAYTLISNIFAHFYLHFSLFFTFLAFIQIFILYLTFKNYRDVFPYVLMTFMLGCVFLTFMNSIRQQIAFCFFMYSIQYIRSKQPFHYFTFILLACLFHKSSILLFPIYFLYVNKSSYFNNLKLQFILLIIALIILNVNVFENLFNSLDTLMIIFGYDQYIDMINKDDSLLFSLERQRGVGFYVILMVDIVLILNSNNIKQYFKDTIFPIIYDIYFFGVIYGYITNGSIILSRPNDYFLGFKFIVAAFSLLYYFRKKENSKKDKMLFYLLIGLYVLIFAGSMFRMKENTAFFTFFWQAG